MVRSYPLRSVWLCCALLLLSSVPGSARSARSGAPASAGLDPLRRACTTTLPPGEGVVCCVFGYVIADGQVVEGAHVMAIGVQDSMTTSSVTDTDTLQPIYSVELNPKLNVQPGQVISLRVEYAGYTSSISYTIQSGSQQVDLVVPRYGPDQYIFERALTVPAEGSFNDLRGVAVDSEGTTYVLDSANDRVSVFDAAGHLVRQWGSPGSDVGQLSVPNGIAVGAAGAVYIADTNNQRIQQFDSQGGLVQTFGGPDGTIGQLSYPKGVAVDRQGNVYVADTGNDRVVKFTHDGQVTAWGSHGSAIDQLSSPTGLAIAPDGTIVVADRGNDRVQRLSSAGVFLGPLGRSGGGAGQFIAPYGVAVDRGGNIYVADTGNNRVQKLTGAGVPAARWGATGNDIGLLEIPYGIAVDVQGKVYVADTGNNRVQIFRPMTETHPFATITHISGGKLGVNKPFVVHGLGQVSDGTATIQTYRWTLDARVIGAGSAIVALPAGSVSIGEHRVTLAVQDSRGRWSEPVATQLVVAGARVFMPRITRN